MFKKSIKLGNFTINENSKPLLVAEISANHNGNIETALKTIKEAKKNGADLIKIQTYTPDTMTINSNKKDFLIDKGLWKGNTLYSLYKQAYTPFEWHDKIFEYCKKIGILCFSTPFDETAVDLLKKFQPPAVKIASFEMNDFSLIKYSSKLKKPLVISTGMASLNEVKDLINFLKRNKIYNCILLHCVSGYPAKSSEYNLRNISFIKNKYNISVGLSDHSIDDLVSISSIALGAKLIEKHFILDRKMGGPDSSFSIEPKELSDLRKNIDRAWESTSKIDFKLKSSEKNSIKFRRSIYAVKKIEKNEKFSEENIRRIRPGYGISPKFFSKIIGKRALKSISKGSPIKLSHFKSGVL